MAFSPDGRLLATSRDKPSGSGTSGPAPPPRAPHGTPTGWAVAFSPDGRLLASGGTDGTVRVWDMSSPAPVSVFEHPGWVLSVAFSPDVYSSFCLQSIVEQQIC